MVISFKKYLNENYEFMLPDYPTQVPPKDDPRGDWITGDSPKGIDFPIDGNVKGIENTKNILNKASSVIAKERELQKKAKPEIFPLAHKTYKVMVSNKKIKG